MNRGLYKTGLEGKLSAEGESCFRGRPSFNIDLYIKIVKINILSIF